MASMKVDAVGLREIAGRVGQISSQIAASGGGLSGALAAAQHGVPNSAELGHAGQVLSSSVANLAGAFKGVAHQVSWAADVYQAADGSSAQGFGR